MSPNLLATMKSTSGHQKWGMRGKSLPVSEGRWKPSSPSSWRKVGEENASSCSLVHGISGMDWLDTEEGKMSLGTHDHPSKYQPPQIKL